MLMPMGTYKGQPIEAAPTRYLIWMVTRDNLRFKYWPAVREALRILRTRLDNLPAVEAELRVDTPLPPRIKPKVDRAAERSRKLAELTARRREEKARKREAYRQAMRHEEHRMAMARREAYLRRVRAGTDGTQIVDAHYFAASKRLDVQRDDDVQDLI